MSSVILWVGNSLLIVVLLRAAIVGLLRRYPLFYIYIGCVLLKQIIDLLFYHFARSFYEPVYWQTELTTIVASYAVLVEIFRRLLQRNPGIARKTQKLLTCFFVLTVGYAAAAQLHEPFVSLSRTIVEIGRDLRYIEGGLLLVILCLLLRYRILLGQNLLGLIVGYSFWVGVNVVNLALWFLPGNESSLLLRTLLPLTYVATLTIWCLALWSVEPEPAQSNENAIERDYQILVAHTRAVLARSSARLVKVMRP
jgi:hypothetical protein